MKAREQWTVTAGGGRNQWTVTASSRCVGAALLFSGARAACTAATRLFAGVAALGNCRVKHNRGLCRTHDPFAVPRLVFVREHGACTRFRCVSAALLSSGARALCTAGTGFTGVAALAIPS